MNRRTTYDEAIKRIHASKAHKKPIVFENPILNLSDIEQKRAHAASSVKYRDDLLKNQQRSNYINEYDRLKGVIERSKVDKLHGYSRLEARLKKIKELAKLSINGEPHEIYQKQQIKKDSKTTQTS